MSRTDHPDGSTLLKRTQRRASAVPVLAAGLLLGCALLVEAPALADVPSYERVRVLDSGREIGDAELSDQDGRPFRLSSLRGRVALVLFGFTNCPDVCPLAMERLRELHDSRGLDPQRVAYVLISVDGERDTPAAMKAFLARYSPDFIGLMAEPARIKPIAAQFSAAFFKGHAGHGGDYSMAHSPQIFVMDTAGRLRAEFYGASVQAMTGVTQALLDEER